MKNILAALQHLLYYCDRVQQIWAVVFLAMLGVLEILHRRWREDDQKLRIWRGLCFVPLVTAIVHYCIYFAGMPVTYLGAYWLLYLLAILPLPGMFLAKRKIGYAVSSALCGVVSVLACASFLCSASVIVNLSRCSYSQAFSRTLDELEEHYVLSEWKEMDYDQIRAEYMPAVLEAEQNQDPAAFSAIMRKLVIRMGDGHVSMAVMDGPYQLKNGFHEYGLGTIRLSDGSVVAVCTGEEAQAAGIHDGTVITGWDGRPVEEVLAGLESPMPAGVAENAEFLKGMYLGCTGGDTVAVRFLDDAGKEQSAQLNALGDEPNTVRSVLVAFLSLPKTVPVENYSTRMLNDRCGYLRLSEEEMDTLLDIKGYLLGVHPEAMEMFREKLDDLSAQGMEQLVIDLRSNGGGMDEIALALTSLFSEEERFGIGLAMGRGKDAYCLTSHNVQADGSYKDLPVLVLTNLNCASAGDGAVRYLSWMPNVTVAGITQPNGCNQETGGMIFFPENQILFSFPVGLVLDVDGNPNIDVAADGISRDPVDIKIPLDAAAAQQIIAGESDYELEWALRYLEEHAP